MTHSLHANPCSWARACRSPGAWQSIPIDFSSISSQIHDNFNRSCLLYKMSKDLCHSGTKRNFNRTVTEKHIAKQTRQWNTSSKITLSLSTPWFPLADTKCPSTFLTPWNITPIRHHTRIELQSWQKLTTKQNKQCFLIIPDQWHTVSMRLPAAEPAPVAAQAPGNPSQLL